MSEMAALLSQLGRVCLSKKLGLIISGQGSIHEWYLGILPENIHILHAD